jgi:hypothetical protein
MRQKMLLMNSCSSRVEGCDTFSMYAGSLPPSAMTSTMRHATQYESMLCLDEQLVHKPAAPRSPVMPSQSSFHRTRARRKPAAQRSNEPMSLADSTLAPMTMVPSQRWVIFMLGNLGYRRYMCLMPQCWPAYLGLNNACPQVAAAARGMRLVRTTYVS